MPVTGETLVAPPNAYIGVAQGRNGEHHTFGIQQRWPFTGNVHWIRGSSVDAMAHALGLERLAVLRGYGGSAVAIRVDPTGPSLGPAADGVVLPRGDRARALVSYEGALRALAGEAALELPYRLLGIARALIREPVLQGFRPVEPPAVSPAGGMSFALIDPPSWGETGPVFKASYTPGQMGPSTLTIRSRRSPGAEPDTLLIRASGTGEYVLHPLRSREGAPSDYLLHVLTAAFPKASGAIAQAMQRERPIGLSRDGQVELTEALPEWP